MSSIEFGRWQDTLSSTTCDALICDPPYGQRTHQANQELNDKFSSNGSRRDISYDSWTADDVSEFVSSWSPRVKSWMACMTSHDLIPAYEQAFREAERYCFAPVPIVQHRVRLAGDGPSSSAVYLMVSRPKERRFLGWGSLPGWYHSHAERDGRIGGKPMSLMSEIIRDYSREGDVVCDPCAGFGTTLVAAHRGRRIAVGSEVDPDTYQHAARRLDDEIRQQVLL